MIALSSRNGGEIQQIGRPFDVYTHPAKMVADFIGLVNFVPAAMRGDRAFIKNTTVSFLMRREFLKEMALLLFVLKM